MMFAIKSCCKDLPPNRMALVQSRESSDEDDSELGAPAATVYGAIAENKSFQKSIKMAVLDVGNPPGAIVLPKLVE